MPKVLHIAWREFKHTALTKAFIIGAVVVPLGIGGLMMLMPALMQTSPAPLHGTLAVVDASGELEQRIERELKPDRVGARWAARLKDVDSPLMQHEGMAQQVADAANARVSVKVQVEGFGADADIEAIKGQVREGKYLAMAVIPPHLLTSSPNERTFELFVPSDASPHHTRMFKEAIAASVVQARVERAGMQLEEAQALVQEPRSDVKLLALDGGESQESAELKMIIPIAFMMLLWISTFTSGNHLLTSTIEEKSNKVMEVLLSAVSPFQLMAGKILGQAAVSFIMLAMYAGVGLVALAAAAKMDLIPPILLVYLIVYFFMAFFMVAAIMAGVGSAVSELRDAQSLVTPAMLVLMVPLILWFPISNDPNGALATVTSFLPPLTPFVMILRVTTAIEPVPMWQIIGSICVGYCWMLVMIWASAKIFRVGLLMYGKPPTPLELLRWVRYN